MNTEAFRMQVRQLLALHQPGSDGAGAAQKAVCVPLRLSSADHLRVLSELIQRVAASQALSSACAAGLLRFELTIDAALTGAAASVAPALATLATCCDACAQDKACGCERETVSAETSPVTPLLRGVVTERDIKALPALCRSAGAAPGTVLTPLARDALRQRGITVHKSKEY